MSLPTIEPKSFVNEYELSWLKSTKKLDSASFKGSVITIFGIEVLDCTYGSAVSEFSDGDSTNAHGNARARCVEGVSGIIRQSVVCRECTVDTLTDDVDAVSRGRIPWRETLFRREARRIATARDDVQEVELLAIETLWLGLQFESVLGLDGHANFFVERDKVEGLVHWIRLIKCTGNPFEIFHDTTFPGTLQNLLYHRIKWFLGVNLRLSKWVLGRSCHQQLGNLLRFWTSSWTR